MRRRLLSVLVAIVAFLGLAPVTQGYIGQAPVQILMSGPSGPVSCGATVTITATVLAAENGKPIAEQVVQWSTSGPASGADRLAQSTSTTDEHGAATVALQLGPEPGKRKVIASVTIVDAGIQVRCLDQLPDTALQRPDDLAGAPLMDAPMPPAVGPAPPPPGAGQFARSVSIPRLGITAPIVEGDGVDVPAAAVAHFPGSAWPGAGSNVYLYGHARAGLFHELWRIRTHDLVELTLASGVVARYEVIRIVPLARADDLHYLDATDGEQLTLQTCLWYDQDSPRFIVLARPLTQDP